ncbi:MAG: hypothetical protein JWL72_800 [Ilumatobacteraceae bacterium]|nr:hypothetical protein [Ilumatobacteraceae bacterium]MCU1387462.1 hypothetical protein [Ilumatobacteraceae bacterium]
MANQYLIADIDRYGGTSRPSAAQALQFAELLQRAFNAIHGRLQAVPDRELLAELMNFNVLVATVTARVHDDEQRVIVAAEAAQRLAGFLVEALRLASEPPDMDLRGLAMTIASRIADGTYSYDREVVLQSSRALATHDVWDVFGGVYADALASLAALVFGYQTLAELEIGSSVTEAASGAAEPTLAPSLTIPTLVPNRRVEHLDADRAALANQALESLLDAARRMVDSGDVSDADAAELQSLMTSAHSESINPRLDVVAYERNAARLAAAVTRLTPQALAVGDLVESLDIDQAHAVTLTSNLSNLVIDANVGQPDPVTDRDASARVLEQFAESMTDVVQLVVAKALNDPDGPVATRMNQLQESIDLSRVGWPTALGLNVVGGALLTGLVWFGGSGTALRCLIWVLKAVYGL